MLFGCVNCLGANKGNTHTHSNTNTHSHTNSLTQSLVHTRIYTYINTYIHTHLYVHTHTCKHTQDIYIYTHTHTVFNSKTQRCTPQKKCRIVQGSRVCLLACLQEPNRCGLHFPSCVQYVPDQALCYIACGV